jgi:hypothetical protein
MISVYVESELEIIYFETVENITLSEYIGIDFEDLI